MSKLFADSFYFFPLLSRNDEAHQKAVAYAQRMDAMLTTEWVLTELADGLAASRHRGVFPEMRQQLLSDAHVQVVSLEMDIYERGIELFGSRLDKDWSLTDCISFLVMQREGIAEALTGDHHFEQAGFVALLK